MNGWEYHQPHHGHYHQNYYNPYLGFYNQPQAGPPQAGPLIKAQESESTSSEQQAQSSEPSKSPQPQIGGYEQSDLSRFNPAEAAAAAALQAASIAAASYEMYPGQQTQQPSKTSTPMGGANSPTSFYPWMKNFNGKPTDLMRFTTHFGLISKAFFEHFLQLANKLVANARWEILH